MCIGTNILTFNETFYKKYVIPAFFICDPEKAHSLLIFTGKYGFIPKSTYKDPPILVGYNFKCCYVQLLIFDIILIYYCFLEN